MASKDFNYLIGKIAACEIIPNVQISKSQIEVQ